MVSQAFAFFTLVASLILLNHSASNNIEVYALGNWSAPFGIVLVSDMLSTLLISLTSFLALCCIFYASAGDDEKGSFFHPLMHFLVMGVNGAFLTGDLFNLFVFFEVLLIASYSLLMHAGDKHKTRSALHYVILNLIGSSIFLIGLGVLYGVLGTLNIADMALKVAALTGDDVALAKIGDKEFLLDATDSIRPYCLLDKNHIVKDAFLVKGKDFGWFETNNLVKTSTDIEENILIDDNFNINQNLKIQFTGYNALELRRNIKSSNQTEVKDSIGKSIGISNINLVENTDNEEEPLVFTAKNNKQFNSNEYVITPKVNLTFSEKDFTEYVRKYPVEFQYPYRKSYNLEIQLKDGFECELPENKSLTTYGDNAYFTYEGSKDGNSIKLSIVIEIRINSFPNVEYSNIEQLFIQLDEKLQENIVVRKKTAN